MGHFRNTCCNSNSAVGWIKIVNVRSLLASAAPKMPKYRQRRYSTGVVRGIYEMAYAWDRKVFCRLVLETQQRSKNAIMYLF